MNVVLDASVALKWVLAEPDSDKAIRPPDDSHNAIHDSIAPDSFALEVS